MSLRKPNILIIGTPGVGKTSVSTKVAKRLGYKHINISKLAIDKKFILKRDEKRDCGVIDESKIRKYLKKKLVSGGYLVEYHSCGFLRKEWFEKIFVLRADIEILNLRLKERNYKQSKIDENIQCEIFQVSLEEAYETFGPELVQELPNNNKIQLKENIKTIAKSVDNSLPGNKSSQ